MGVKYENLTGKRFNRLVVLRLAKEKKQYGRTMRYWLCKCDCGNEKEMQGMIIKRKSTISCGCYNVQFQKQLKYKHGMNKTKFHKKWIEMKFRCFNKKATTYKYYGGSGITVCDRWREFTHFRDDMYKSYIDHVKQYGEKETTIDRINPFENYEPNNCRWATLKEQANNKKSKYVSCK